MGFAPGDAKSIRVDGAAVDSLSTSPARPLASVFLPERLELVKGAPASRRAHLDRFVAAVWPARAETRTAYSRALSQRNALLGRIRAGASSAATLDTWDARACPPRDPADGRPDARRWRCSRRASPSWGRSSACPRPSRWSTGRARAPAIPADLAAELAERRAADLDRGFTAHGPHRDDLRLVHGGRALRQYGSQGQQRVALLALLFAERDVLRDQRGATPLMLLDDVMSELDASRRALLAELLREGGQSLLTTTEVAHVPDAGARGHAGDRGRARGGPPGGGGADVRRRRPAPLGDALEAFAVTGARPRRCWRGSRGSGTRPSGRPSPPRPSRGPRAPERCSSTAPRRSGRRSSSCSRRTSLERLNGALEGPDRAPVAALRFRIARPR